MFGSTNGRPPREARVADIGDFASARCRSASAHEAALADVAAEVGEPEIRRAALDAVRAEARAQGIEVSVSEDGTIVAVDPVVDLADVAGGDAGPPGDGTRPGPALPGAELPRRALDPERLERASRDAAWLPRVAWPASPRTSR
jgi:hypothetical protein